MPKEQAPGKPQTRRYTPEEKAAAVRIGTIQTGTPEKGVP
jgi:hypothetical protein